MLFPTLALAQGIRIAPPGAASVTASSVTTFTNKTIDCEATGNNCTQPVKLWLPVAACQAGTASLIWDSPSANAATAACYGTNAKGVADFDATTDESLYTWILLPEGFTGSVDAALLWSAAATSGSARFTLNIDCAAAGEDHDLASSNATNFTGTPNGTANRLVRTTQTSISITGCAANELAKINLVRDADGTTGTDDMTGDARVIMLELTIRRTM